MYRELAKRHPLVYALRYANFGLITGPLRYLFTEFSSFNNYSTETTVVFSNAFMTFVENIFTLRVCPELEKCKALCLGAVQFERELMVFTNFEMLATYAYNSDIIRKMLLFKLCHFAIPYPREEFAFYMIYYKALYTNSEITAFVAHMQVQNANLRLKCALAYISSDILLQLLASRQIYVYELSFTACVAVFTQLNEVEQAYLLYKRDLSVETLAQLTYQSTSYLINEYLIYYALKNGVFIKLLEINKDYSLLVYKRIAEEISVKTAFAYITTLDYPWMKLIGVLLAYYTKQRIVALEDVFGALTIAESSHLLNFFVLDKPVGKQYSKALDLVDWKLIESIYFILVDTSYLPYVYLNNFELETIAKLLSVHPQRAVELSGFYMEQLAEMLTKNPSNGEYASAMLLCRCYFGDDFDNGSYLTFQLTGTDKQLCEAANSAAIDENISAALCEMLTMFQKPARNFNDIYQYIKRLNELLNIAGYYSVVLKIHLEKYAALLNQALLGNPVFYFFVQHGIAPNMAYECFKYALSIIYLASVMMYKRLTDYLVMKIGVK